MHINQAKRVMDRYIAKLNDDENSCDEVELVFRRHFLPQDIFDVINDDNEVNRHNLWLSERGIHARISRTIILNLSVRDMGFMECCVIEFGV